MHLLFTCHFINDGAEKQGVLTIITSKNILLFSGTLLMKCVYFLLFCKDMSFFVSITVEEKVSMVQIQQLYRKGLGYVPLLGVLDVSDSFSQKD